MHVAILQMRNWLCYRGTQTIELEPIAYAVTASRDGDAERSNWGGKSSLLEAIRFALTGEHRHRLEEGWISEGEKEGGVDITLSDNTLISRYRKPGAGTQLEVTTGGKTFKGDEAQRRVEEIIGLGAEDFETTSYFAQGATSQIVRADPAARTAMVARWLRLERLERGSEIVRGMAKSAERDAAALSARAAAGLERITRARTGYREVGEMTEALVQHEALLVEWEGLLAASNEEEANARLLEERARVVSEGLALRKEHDEEDGEAIARELDEADADREVAARAYETAKIKRANRVSVATGTFNGRCPVAGIACPATDQINALGEAAVEEAQRADEDLGAALAEADRTRLRCRAANERAVVRRNRQERLKTLRDRALSMAGALPPSGGSGLALDAVQAERDRVSGQVADLRRRIREVEEAKGEVDDLLKTERGFLRTLVACREASLLFGAAKRRLAEGVLGEIAARANGMLSDAGVDLSLALSWDRETKDPAEACAACGASFPASARVKRCEACGAARGKKRVQRLDVELSARSGAAEDLAGLALCLSAGAWLRGERGSPWGLVAMDEPWAQLDKAHRRAASAYVPSLLAAAQVRQALVISHDPVSVGSLPGRIEIVSDGKWSRVAVAA